MSASTAPTPSAYHAQAAGYHWLQRMDPDGLPGAAIQIFQWQPGVQRWCEPGDVATGRDLELLNYVYVGPCPLPPPDHENEQLLTLVKALNSRFRSANGAYVQRTHITSDEWNRINDFLFKHLR